MYLLTRPVPKLTASVAAFEAEGLNVAGVAPVDIGFDQPVIDALAGLLHAPATINTVIVTSTFAAQILTSLRASIPANLTVVAVGTSTAALLANSGLTLQVPASQDSEGILALPVLKQANHQHIVIIKGQGGRTLIADELRKAGNRVDEMAVYFRRQLAEPVTTNDWQWSEVKGIITTSAEMAEAMFAAYPPSMLCQRPWLAVSERVAKAVQSQGVQQVSVCPGASDSAIINWVKENWE